MGELGHPKANADEQRQLHRHGGMNPRQGLVQMVDRDGSFHQCHRHIRKMDDLGRDGPEQQALYRA